MRIPKTWVLPMAKKITEHLVSTELVKPLVPLNNLISATETLIMDELMVEDRLNEEVREVLKKYTTDIEKGKLDYKRLFELTKQKLIRERNLIL